MTEKYWALVDLRYPAGDAEYAKAAKGDEYKEVVVKVGEPLVTVSEKTLKAFLSMGRDVITDKAPKVPKPSAPLDSPKSPKIPVREKRHQGGMMYEER
jgi:hypothetical protein